MFEALDELKRTPLYAKEDTVIQAEGDFMQNMDQGDEAAFSEMRAPEAVKADMQGSTGDPCLAREEENTNQRAHTDSQSFQVVADRAGCYADESGMSDGAVPVAICMVPERSANELLQQALAFAPAEVAQPMRLFRVKHGEESCSIKLFVGLSRPSLTV